MKTQKLIILALGLINVAALPAMAGIGVEINVPAPVVVVPAPVVTVQTPAVTVQAVPDSYAWDGTEYVGVVGSQYYYLGPGNVWLTLDAPRQARFHDWEHSNPDWRTHATHNDRYRNDAHAHDAPAHDNHESVSHDSHDSHGSDHGHDSDHH